MAAADGVDLDILDAADHQGTCRCYKCKKYWTAFRPMPPDGTDGTDFNLAEWEEYSEMFEEWLKICPFDIAEITEIWTE